LSFCQQFCQHEPGGTPSRTTAERGLSFMNPPLRRSSMTYALKRFDTPRPNALGLSVISRFTSEARYPIQIR
jgi:hypothetical protein